jgi:hypothetical protein
MIIGHVITGSLVLINAYLPGKFFGYGAIKQYIILATIGGNYYNSNMTLF